MRNLLLLIITVILVGCSNTSETITVTGTIIGEDNLVLDDITKLLTPLSDCHVYVIENDNSTYMAMTPSTSVDPLDSAFVGTFVLGDVIASGESSVYFGGELKSTKHEFRNLISYK